MSKEERFTTEWWKEVFKRGRPMGHGGVELRDEDKYLFLMHMMPGGYWRLRELTKAFRERFGEEAEKIIAEVRKRDHERVQKLLRAVLPEATDPVSVVEHIATEDGNIGSDFEIRIAPDGSSATLYITRCTLMEAGTASCQESGTLDLGALLRAIAPVGEKMEAVVLEAPEPGVPQPGPYACPFFPNGLLVRWKK